MLSSCPSAIRHQEVLVWSEAVAHSVYWYTTADVIGGSELVDRNRQATTQAVQRIVAPGLHEKKERTPSQASSPARGTL